MRSIKNLLKRNGRIYVYLQDEKTGKIFLENAEKEGVTFGDGVNPTKRKADSIFAINDDLTINYVGYIGHLAFNFGTDKIVRIDYYKYISGDDDYIV
jgi:hypothetical protein